MTRQAFSVMHSWTVVALCAVSWGGNPTHREPDPTNQLRNRPTSSSDVAFAPRNELIDFGNQLNVLHRDSLRRGSVTTFVDLEGFVVWTQEYLRYRVNGCPHETAVSNVLSQVKGGGVAPICGAPPGGQPAFPPRDQTFAFGTQLNAVYRDTLRRNAVATFVDLEGWMMGIQEYVRLRVSGCSHPHAVNKVFTRIKGGKTQPTC